jgi:glycosyltransferase involved in cell wall biosynthesis
VLAGAYRDRHQALVDQVRALSLDGLVHFLGEVSDVSGLLRATDLAVFSSSAEGLPNAVLEAMAAGLAVAGTDYPGIREALGPSGSQLLAPAGDAGGLAERIVTAALDAALRHRLGLLARGRAESEFTVDRMCRRMSQRIATELPVSRRAIPSTLAWLPRGRGAGRS